MCTGFFACFVGVTYRDLTIPINTYIVVLSGGRKVQIRGGGYITKRDTMPWKKQLDHCLLDNGNIQVQIEMTPEQWRIFGELLWNADKSNQSEYWELLYRYGALIRPTDYFARRLFVSLAGTMY